MSEIKDYKFDKRASSYDDGFEGKVSGRFYRLLLREVVLHPDACVLDVGCGTGTIDALLAAIPLAFTSFTPSDILGWFDLVVIPVFFCNCYKYKKEMSHGTRYCIPKILKVVIKHKDWRPAAADLLLRLTASEKV